MGDWEEQALPSPNLKQNENRAVTSFSLKNLWRRRDLPLGNRVISSDLKKIEREIIPDSLFSLPPLLHWCSLQLKPLEAKGHGSPLLASLMICLPVHIVQRRQMWRKVLAQLPCNFLITLTEKVFHKKMNQGKKKKDANQDNKA